MNQYLVPANEIRNFWSFVRSGLETILQKSPESWIPEDVYADCFHGKSMLWVFFDAGKPIGFAILQPRGESLHCWCGYAVSHGYFKKALRVIVEIAKGGGAKQLTFDSWRPGWEKFAPKFGFKARTWVKEI